MTVIKEMEYPKSFRKKSKCNDLADALWTLDLQNCNIINLYCFKSLKQFITGIIEKTDIDDIQYSLYYFYYFGSYFITNSFSTIM